MTPHTNILFTSVGAAVTGDLTGSEFAFQSCDGRTHNIIAVSVSAGTGTVKVQGRNGPGDDWKDAETVTASDTKLIALFKRLRVLVEGGTALQVFVTSDRPGKVVS